MARKAATMEPSLPWVEHGEDRGFRWLMTILIVLFIGAALFMNAIKLPEVERKTLDDISPRLAKLILEKKKVKPPPPPPPKKEKPKEEKKEKKKEVKKKEKPKEKKLDDREVAKQSGLIALSDELEDLRESFDLDDVIDLPQQTTGKQEVKVSTSSDLLTSAASKSSGGIKTDTLNRTITTNELTQRQTTKVESKIETDQTQLAKAETSSTSGKSNLKTRSADEIERVFQQNKGGIFNIYNRALRKNPSLQGQVVVEITIAPNGTVSSATIVSSELDDKSLERKLILKIKKFKFASANVSEITVTYPIDFLPS
ncbi:MAG: AgmX/PglI C-terminal domain-containing protein [Pseudomonadota bacterium]